MNERRSALALIILLALLALPTAFVCGMLCGAWIDSKHEERWKQRKAQQQKVSKHDASIS